MVSVRSNLNQNLFHFVKSISVFGITLEGLHSSWGLKSCREEFSGFISATQIGWSSRAEINRSKKFLVILFFAAR
jgi:hypothetical protein